MKIRSVTDNKSMKWSHYMHNIVLFMIMSVTVSAFSGGSWYEESVIIYKDPDPLRYGVATDLKQERLRDFYDFGLGFSHEIMHYEESGFLTATLMDNTTVEMLETIFREVPTAKASRGSLKFDGYYNAITFGEHELYRITHRYHYNELHHQVTSLLDQPHYLYHNRERGIMIEFSLERPPLDMMLLLRQDMLEYLDQVDSDQVEQKVAAIRMLEQLKESYEVYERGYVVRIHRANTFKEKGYTELEDVMFAATLIGAQKQYWQGIPQGNNYILSVLMSLEEDPRMAIYLNQGVAQ